MGRCQVKTGGSLNDTTPDLCEGIYRKTSGKLLKRRILQHLSPVFVTVCDEGFQRNITTMECEPCPPGTTSGSSDLLCSPL